MLGGVIFECESAGRIFVHGDIEEFSACEGVLFGGEIDIVEGVFGEVMCVGEGLIEGHPAEALLVGLVGIGVDLDRLMG